MKSCVDCKNSFQEHGQNHKRCDSCARISKLETMRQWRLINVLKGIGSGSTTGFGSENHMFKHGQCVFRRWAKEKLIQLNYRCERCGTTIDASKRGSWAGHHKDHNRQHNVKENLEVLCKRCHQIEHECWKSFEGVTTISKESTQEIVEAPSTPIIGVDDIVCSA